RAPEMKYLRLLNRADLDRLLSGDRVSFPPGAVPSDEIYAILAKRFSPHDEEFNAEQIQGMIVHDLQATQKNGISLQIDFNRQFSRFHLLLQFGGSGANVLTQLGDAEDRAPVDPDQSVPAAGGR